MEQLKKSIVPVLLSVVVAVAVSLSLATPSVQTIVKEKVVGSATSPDISSPYFSFGDVRQWAVRSSLITASNTVCSLQSPVSTSSLLFASIRLETSTSSASELQFSKGTSPSGTSTLLSANIYKVGANGSAEITASSSLSGTLFAPSTYLTVGMVGATQGTVSPTGACQAIWVAQ